MKKTLLFTALLSLGTISSQGQAPLSKVLMKALAPTATQKKTSDKSQKLPMHSWTYDYDGMVNTYRYESDYTYNANGTLATELQRKHETPQTRFSYTYDTVATSFQTLVTQSLYDASEGTWGSEFETYRYDVKHNEQGQITKLEEFEYNDNWEMEPVSTIDISYKADGMPEVVTITMHEGLDGGDVVMPLTDIEWVETSGQEFAEMGEIFSLISGGKQLKSATMGLKYSEMDLSGPLNITYADNGDISANVSFSLYGMTAMAFTINQTTTDTYGSYQLDAIMTALGQNEYSRTTVTKDDHGNVTQTDEYEGTSAEDLEKTSSERTTYDYLEYINQRGVTYYSWDETTDTYTPYLKVVYDEFTTGIEKVENNAISSSVERVFSIDGQLLGTTTENLPSGLYIVQKDGKTTKVMKR